MKISTTFAAAALAAGLIIGSGCRTNQTPEAQLEDARITSSIKTKLASDVRLATLTNIDVTTTNGVVTLAGVVSSETEKGRIEEMARTVSGVSKVNSGLQVSGARQD